VTIICDMLGIPEEHREVFYTSSRNGGRLLDPVPLSRAEIDAANGIVAQPEAVAVAPVKAVEVPKPIAAVGAKTFTPRAIQRKGAVAAHARSASRNLRKAHA